MYFIGKICILSIFFIYCPAIKTYKAINLDKKERKGSLVKFKTRAMNETIYRHIDLRKLKENTFGDHAILRMIIEQFIEDIDAYVKVFEGELPQQNWQALFQATHKIKPNISMFGIDALVPVILELEDNFKNEHNLDRIDELTNTTVTVLNNVKKELQTELKSMINE